MAPQLEHQRAPPFCFASCVEPRHRARFTGVIHLYFRPAMSFAIANCTAQHTASLCAYDEVRWASQYEELQGANMMRYKAKVAACVLPLLLAFAGCSQNPQANGASEGADTPAAADKPSVLGQI